MHRRAAGEPGNDGWYLAESTEGGYSVKVPYVFNDFTGIRRTEKGNVTRLYLVGTKTPDEIQFSVLKGVRADSKPIPESLESLARGFSKDKDVKEKRLITYAGMSGIKFKVIGPATATLARIFMDETTVFTLTVENKAAPMLTRDIEQAATIFFDSLQLK